MGYDKTIASGVASVFEAKRNARKSLIDSRREELYAKIPELKAIDDEISSVSFSLFKKVADGFDQEEAAKTIKSETERLCAKRDDLIKEAGYPVSYLNPPYNCRKCKDEGFIGNSYCECFKKELLTKVFAESNLATLSKNKFSDFDLSWYSETSDKKGETNPRKEMERILNGCKTYVENFEKIDNSLLFTGSSGLGKTFLSSCIANELIEKGYSVIYQSASIVFSLLDKIKFSKSPSEADFYAAERLIDCDLLILDDLGTEFITDFSASELFRILNTRAISGKKTIISTNLTLEDLKRVYSERIFSRIIGNFVIFKFQGTDIRFLKKKK